MNGTIFLFLQISLQKRKVYSSLLCCASFPSCSKRLFLWSRTEIVMESRVLYVKSGSSTTENHQCFRKAWCLLYRGGATSPSPKIKMSFMQTTKICRKMLGIKVWNIELKLQTNPTELWKICCWLWKWIWKWPTPEQSRSEWTPLGLVQQNWKVHWFRFTILSKLCELSVRHLS